MKLRYSPASPYVRKILATAIETGLDDGIELVPANVWDPATDIARDNPLGKVPALITDGGEALYDSPVICEYLDSLHGGQPLFPPAGGARWRALRRQALGDGILDAGILRLLEGRRPESERSSGWIERQKNVVGRALDAFEDEAGDLDGPVTIGHVTLGVALGYLDFRYADDAWRDGRPGLDAWYAAFSERRSMTATVPKNPA